MEETVTSAPVSAPAAPVAAPPEPTSIADHAAAYSPEPTDQNDSDSGSAETQGDRDAQGRFRSRAKSQRATPADVPRIQELTRRLRETEEKYSALEKRVPAQAPTQTYKPAPVTQFNKPEPTIDQFVDRDDPYGAHLRASMKWELEREAHESAAQARAAYEGYQTHQAREEYRQAEFSHQQRLVQAIASDPRVGQAIQAVQESARAIPPLLDQTIVLDPQGVEIVVFLANHPAVLDEIALLTAAQPVNEQTVARTRRLLRQRMTAGATGSVASSNVLPTAPRPPNPVRTGSMRPSNEAPSEGASIADHAKYWPTR